MIHPLLRNSGTLGIFKTALKTHPLQLRLHVMPLTAIHRRLPLTVKVVYTGSDKPVTRIQCAPDWPHQRRQRVSTRKQVN